MNISIVGSGYVGLVTGVCLAELGNTVICLDNDKKKIGNLKKGIVPIFEPGLHELIASNVKQKRLKFTSNLKQAVHSSEIIFIAVGTPAMNNGEADHIGIENVARNIAINMPDYRLIVEKSTVPVETGEWVKHTIQNNIKGKIKFDVASNPEFLREGQAINDFMHPDRIVIGVESEKAKNLLVSLYKPLGAQLVITDIKSAELIKHASNSYLAAKISFINAISQICEKSGADVVEVAKGMGLDKRIGPGFLNAGIGYGGSCFPKDVDAFITISEKLGYNFELLKTIKRINQQMLEFFLQKIKNNLWIIKDKTIGILGISFKPNTDDIRNAPSLEIIKALQDEGAKVKAYDPQGAAKAKEILKGVAFCSDSYAVSKGADCLLILTEWDEFKELDLLKIKKLMRHPLVIDGRNIYDPVKLSKMGLKYIGIGRSANFKR
ncbi:MAG: UDP-glucose/GDP-mannose dehydrogenase family protein [Candidatus Omnitrophica bacterium]|nr:UDP-glucose/GDP-mannose dehydrogenase family protein [Candidatus Omnitrophota bacterium]